MADSGRSSQFSFAENICILEEYNAAKSILMNKFSDYNANNKKHKAWSTITDKVNSINPSVPRTVKDVQKRFKNMVQEAKKEIFKRKKPATGGGPKIIIEIYGDESPMFWGIPGGRESGVSCVTSPAAGENTSPHTAVASASLGQSREDLDSTQVAPAGSGSDTESQKGTASKITMNHILEKQYEVLTLEEAKLKLEIQKLELEKTKLTLEIQKLGHEL
ncbi:Myb-related transcription factor, partner of profilin [Labeo rohita]|uniref:Myb-related transcription factor, partner of profilin n=1 Tax=Labeo rohita TaxID=84645 RepID=A0ABQ8L7C3_LABRO|nr:Myb-related transcription factor, partner of profilin [Labeo rohita]